MGTKIIYQDSGQEVNISRDGIAIVTARELERSAILPEHPTINGFINDSTIINPRRVQIEGQISNVNDYFHSEESTAGSYRLEYEALFEALLASEEVLVIETYNRQYSDMRLETFNISDTIDGFRFSATFKEMFYGTSKKVKSSVTNTSAQKKKVATSNPKKQSVNKTSATTNKNVNATTNKANVGTGTINKNGAVIEAKKSIFFKIKEYAQGAFGN